LQIRRDSGALKLAGHGLGPWFGNKGSSTREGAPAVKLRMRIHADCAGDTFARSARKRFFFEKKKQKTFIC
jgi:hypothetical protein